jgi:uncharacterized protein YqjF (DUF2071 family)
MKQLSFLTAQWEYLVMLNYEVNPTLLRSYIPPGTEIDYFNGKAFVSVVGFLFNNTRVMGVKWPGYINFEEANLRYYIRYADTDGFKRGVGFVSEIVPKPLVAGIANFLYKEHYSTAKMSHCITTTDDLLKVEYQWQRKDEQQNRIYVEASPMLQEIEKGSEAEFIFEHYFGYTALNENTTIEYTIQHPRWQVYPVLNYSLTCDAEKLYGKDFAAIINNQQPNSVFLARGSAVQVKMPRRIKVAELKSNN